MEILTILILLHDYVLISGHCKPRSIIRLYIYSSNIFLQAADCIYLHLPSPLLELQVVPYTRMSSLDQNNRASCPVSCSWHWSVVDAYDREEQGKHTSLVYPPHFQQSAAQRHLQWQAVSKTQRYIFFFPCMRLVNFEPNYNSGS